MREQAVGTRKRVSHFSYLLDDALGRGSFSQVYRGRDDRTGLPVALKVLELAPLPDHAHLDSEIKALAALRHPNIVRLISVCRTAHRCYLVTEYCDGGTLEAWLPLASQLQRLKMCAGLCRGFLGMAEKGILHRDLKPANVLLQGGTARIADFGLSAFGKDIRDQYCVGSPLYMAPESLRSANYSQKSDVWSLGVLVFQILFRQLPWQADSEQQLLQKIAQEPLNPPQVQGLSPSCYSFVSDCLRLKPADRPSPAQIARHPFFLQVCELADKPNPVEVPELQDSWAEFNFIKRLCKRCKVLRFPLKDQVGNALEALARSKKSQLAVLADTYPDSALSQTIRLKLGPVEEPEGQTGELAPLLQRALREMLQSQEEQFRKFVWQSLALLEGDCRTQRECGSWEDAAERLARLQDTD